jgi:hypothetical protein
MYSQRVLQSYLCNLLHIGGQKGDKKNMID